MKDILVRILGGGREIGRSAISIESGGRSVLLDYGVSFDERDVPILPLTIPPSTIDGIVITHSHLDHVGSAPLMYISSKPMAYTTPLSREINRVMLEDFYRLSSYYLPFEHKEIEEFLLHTRTLSFNSEIDIGSWKVIIKDAGHIPGSLMVLLDRGSKRILYTGDVNTIATRLVSPADLSGVDAEVLIMEGTYANAEHPERSSVEKDLIDSIREVLDIGGTVLIPAFSLGRSQEILMLLAEKMPHAEVFYDGMIREITELFLQYKNYINKPELLEKAVEIFTEVSGWDMRRKVWRENGVIIASAGMLKGGPALYYLKRLSDKKNSAVFLVSFQGKNTPGRMLLERGVFMENGPRVVARVQWFDFSSHAGFSGLMSIVKNLKSLEKVVIVHTDPSSAEFLKSRIEGELGIDVEIPAVGSVIEIK
ncbi:MAG: MBL fold metallo-hydrolase [Sulfolobales archaeon]